MAKKANKIPQIGIFNTILNLPKIINNPAVYFQDKLREHDGLVVLQLQFGRVCVTDRPDLIRYVLQKNHKNYTKTSILKTVIRDQVGDGLLTSDGEYWLKQRRAIQPGFHKKRLEGISKIMVDEINHYMDNTFDTYAENEEEIDLVKEMTHLTFKIVSKSLFGEEVAEDKLEAMGEIIAKGQQFIVDQIRKPFLKPWYKISGAYARNNVLKEKGDGFILEVIQERKQSAEKRDDLLDMLLETTYEDGSTMADQQLLDEAKILYVAGHETSAVAMTWIWYLIATHPAIEEKLFNSVADALGDNDPSFSKLKDLGYALQVVEESMRLYPPVWLIDREPQEDDEFEGIPIKKKQDVVCLIYSLHLNPKYWPNPTKFDPERFSPENKSKQIPFSYIPFGGGPRLCIGNNFALMEMQFAVAMMVKRYKFELTPNQQIEVNPLVTLHPRYGVKVRVRRRAGRAQE